jgi:hypothetical protein
MAAPTKETARAAGPPAAEMPRDATPPQVSEEPVEPRQPAPQAVPVALERKPAPATPPPLSELPDVPVKELPRIEPPSAGDARPASAPPAPSARTPRKWLRPPVLLPQPAVFEPEATPGAVEAKQLPEKQEPPAVAPVAAAMTAAIQAAAEEAPKAAPQERPRTNVVSLAPARETFSREPSGAAGQSSAESKRPGSHPNGLTIQRLEVEIVERPKVEPPAPQPAPAQAGQPGWEWPDRRHWRRAR